MSEPEVLGPNDSLPTRTPEGSVTVDLFAIMQQAMVDEGASMKQYDGQSEYEYFRNWNQKWRRMKPGTEEGPLTNAQMREPEIK